MTGSDLENYGYLTESDLINYLVGNLSDYLSEYVTGSDLSEYVTLLDLDQAGFLKAEDLPDYLSEYVTESDLANAGFLSESDLSEFLSDYATMGDLSDALSDYVRYSELDGYLSEVLGDYVSTSYLSEVLSDYLSASDFEPYLSEAGVVTYEKFPDALECYLSDYGGEVIYNAISQYIHP